MCRDRPGQPGTHRTGGNLQNTADRLEPESVAIGDHQRGHLFDWWSSSVPKKLAAAFKI